MVDEKPPRFAGDERETLLTLLQYQRESVLRKLAGIDDDAARRQGVPSGTSLLWLVKHLAAAEVTWVLRRFAAQDVSAPDDTVEPHDTVPSAADAYRATWAKVDSVVASAPSLDERCRGLDGDPPANLRWVLSHLLEETARHAGHADMLREQIDGEVGR